MYGHLSCAVVPKIYVGRLLALRFLETSRNHLHETIWRSVSEKATLWRNIYIASYANYYKVSQVEKV